jgi:hypothetical protein
VKGNSHQSELVLVSQTPFRQERDKSKGGRAALMRDYQLEGLKPFPASQIEGATFPPNNKGKGVTRERVL